jgi:hypothetical protein
MLDMLLIIVKNLLHHDIYINFQLTYFIRIWIIMKNNNKTHSVENNIIGYKYLYYLENLIRDWLHEILSDKIGINYFGEGAFLIKQKRINLYELANKRRKDDIRDKIPGANELPLIYYLDLWHLGVVIKKKWGLLYTFFPGKWTINELETRFAMLSGTRNRIAHSQLLRKVEVGLLKEMLDFFLRNISNKTIEQVNSQYETTKRRYSFKNRKFIMKTITLITNHEKLPLGFEANIAEIKVENMQDGKIKSLIEIIESDLIQYTKLRNLIGGFSKVQMFCKTSNLIINLKYLLEEENL